MTMYTTYDRLSSVSPARSTPSLEPDSLYPSPPADEYLTTPDLSEWKETRRLEYEKAEKWVEDAKSVGHFRQFTVMGSYAHLSGS